MRQISERCLSSFRTGWLAVALTGWVVNSGCAFDPAAPNLSVDASTPDDIDAGFLDGGGGPDGEVRDAGPPDSGIVLVVPPFSSNYDPAQLNPELAVTIDCEAEINTSTNGPSIVSWCDGQEPLLVDPGPGEPILLPVISLEITEVGMLVVSGPRPLIVAVFGDATIAGDILVIPAGRSCDVSREPRNQGGGGGGGFGRDGARGGEANDSDNSGGTGSPAQGNEELIPLLTGCSGRDGDLADPDSAGAGGGAIEISVGGRLTISDTATISAPGNGGDGGHPDLESGGSGGGSGGAILLEANIVDAEQARVFANGGGGGEASRGQGLTVGRGAPGLAGTQPAPGGRGGNGANGGNGGSWSWAAVSGSGSDDYAGGGGGGAIGRIRVNAMASCSLSTNFSPMASIDPDGPCS